MGKVFLFKKINGTIFDYHLGKYSWPDGRSYDGMWFRNKMHGKGKFVWPNGNVYEGDYQNDIREGSGSYTW